MAIMNTGSNVDIDNSRIDSRSFSVQSLSPPKLKSLKTFFKNMLSNQLEFLLKYSFLN